MNPLYEVMTAAEAAEIWRLSPITVRQACTGYKKAAPRFTVEEARKAAGTWLITKIGMERVFGSAEERRADIMIRFTEFSYNDILISILRAIDWYSKNDDKNKEQNYMIYLENSIGGYCETILSQKLLPFDAEDIKLLRKWIDDLVDEGKYLCNEGNLTDEGKLFYKIKLKERINKKHR